MTEPASVLDRAAGRLAEINDGLRDLAEERSEIETFLRVAKRLSAWEPEQREEPPAGFGSITYIEPLPCGEAQPAPVVAGFPDVALGAGESATGGEVVDAALPADIQPETDAVEDYKQAFATAYPMAKAPTITRRGSWWLVIWDGQGQKSARTEEIERMTRVLRGRNARELKSGGRKLSVSTLSAMGIELGDSAPSVRPTPETTSTAARMDVPGSLPEIKNRPVLSDNGGGYPVNGEAKVLAASSEVPGTPAGIKPRPSILTFEAPVDTNEPESQAIAETTGPQHPEVSAPHSPDAVLPAAT